MKRRKFKNFMQTSKDRKKISHSTLTVAVSVRVCWAHMKCFMTSGDLKIETGGHRLVSTLFQKYILRNIYLTWMPLYCCPKWRGGALGRLLRGLMFRQHTSHRYCMTIELTFVTLTVYTLSWATLQLTTTKHLSYHLSSPPVLTLCSLIYLLIVHFCHNYN